MITDGLMIIATLIAAFAAYFGPIKAVKLTRELDEERSKKERKSVILRALMMYRKNRFHTDFVAALNLIEIEFYEHDNVISYWKELLKVYREINLHDMNKQEVNDSLMKKLDSALADLIKSIALIIGYKIDKMDLLQNSYFPKKWEWDDLLFRRKELLMLDLLENKRSLNISLSSNQDN